MVRFGEQNDEEPNKEEKLKTTKKHCSVCAIDRSHRCVNVDLLFYDSVRNIIFKGEEPITLLANKDIVPLFPPTTH